MLLSKANLDSVKFATKDRQRTSIMGLFINREETAATDGKRIMVVALPRDDEKEFPVVPGHQNGDSSPRGRGAILPPDTVASLSKNLPKASDTPEILKRAKVTFDKEGTFATASVTDLEKGQVFTTQLLEGDYPDYASCFPEEKPCFEIGVNAHLLEEILAFASKHSLEWDAGCVRLSFYKATQAIKITSLYGRESQAWKACLMPVKLPEGEK